MEVIVCFNVNFCLHNREAAKPDKISKAKSAACSLEKEFLGTAPLELSCLTAYSVCVNGQENLTP